ncbi:MAG TPA: right-handed parallel beta-helix repeat-containing protein [Bacteroidales bacterium]|nr:right-handed parallel beta-helix repeat-containing protein [Bacteroidales bacterium]HOL98834.1 right-handed parallel beta-helix repeat-containing protein [Bacteroidales bacterium]HOM37066.1 right-handed parallel beta-helix repeat-containing protein [Bacteroidales bacterium]HPD24691.1 right-handed parallel beta-helix repeat-containing protein [Bacteroidales bacterium]HRT00436.1 right-handed parallel beta-helix repeat-containing protein [Bacteroidales bacterium]
MISSIIVLCCGTKLFSQPKKYYVNDGSTLGDIYCKAVGNNSGADRGKSLGTPARTVQYIIDTYTLGAGDTVFIDTGLYNTTSLYGTTYEYSISISSSDQGSSSAYLVFKGAGKDNTKFQSPTTTSVNVISINGSDYVVFQDLSVENRYSGYCVIFNGTSRTEYNIIKNCEIKYSGISSNSDAIYLNGDVQNCIIENNYIEHIGDGTKAAINIYGTSATPPKNNIFRNNTIYSPGRCIRVFANTTTSTYFPENNKFEKNKIENNSSSAIISIQRAKNTEITKNTIIQGNNGDMINTSDNVTGLKIVNNFFINNNDNPSGIPAAISVSAAAPEIDIYFNSIYMKRGYGFYGSANNAYSNIRLKNNIINIGDEFCQAGDCFCIYKQTGIFASSDFNLFYTNASNDIVYDSGSKAYFNSIEDWQLASHSNDNSDDANSIQEDPLFINPSTNDLRIYFSSPASGSGVQLTGISDDILNNSRPDSPSIGAFEANSLLPVVLVDFGASCFTSHAPLPLVSWTTAAEINNDHFILEKSCDLKNFTIVAKIPGKGFSNQLNKYSFIDDTEPCEKKLLQA